MLIETVIINWTFSCSDLVQSFHYVFYPCSVTLINYFLTDTGAFAPYWENAEVKTNCTTFSFCVVSN